jgi:guanylate kinase
VQDVASKSRVCILDIDVQGAISFKAKAIDAKYVFMEAPSLADLESRLRGRGTETEDKIKTRVDNAQGEIDKAHGTKGLFQHFLVNGSDPNDTYRQLEALLRPEVGRCRDARKAFAACMNANA